MATLERIRRRSGLLIIIIGLAMLAFILTDLLGSGNSIFRADANVIGIVDGENIDAQVFSRKMAEREADIRRQNPQQAQFVTQKQLADAIWDETIREKVLGEQYEELGFTVTSAELAARVKGNPSVRSAPGLQDQNTGQFSEARLQQYLNVLREQRATNPQAAEEYENWLKFEENVRTTSLQTKYIAAVEKGLYMPAPLAKDMNMRNNSQINAQVVVLEYSSISDSAVNVTDNDFRKYYEEHKEEFKTEAAANIEYVNFAINPSEADHNEVREELNSILNGKKGGDSLESFRYAKEDSLFASGRSDLPVVNDYYSMENLPQGLDSAFFTKDVGYVKGPYEVGNYYRLTKITDRKNLPDSVKARHILISFQTQENPQAPRNFQEAKTVADSLLKVVESDTADFAKIATEMSDDPGSAAKGGDLGWFDRKQMVKPFSNFSFMNDKGDIGMVLSRFGYHIIEILDQKGSIETVKLVSISRELTPSDATIDKVYNDASTFAAAAKESGNFSAKAEEMGYTPRPVTSLKPFDESIAGLGNNREIVRWANNEETESGAIQLFNNGNNSYVVVKLTDAYDKGYRSLESVKEQIRPLVIKAKKAEQLKEKMSKAMEGKSDIGAIASALGVTVAEQTMTFRSSTVNQYGNEPKVAGTASGLSAGQISKPIEGNNGVYLVSVTGVTPAQEMPDYREEGEKYVGPTRSRAQSQVLESLKDNAKIEDRRAKFY